MIFTGHVDDTAAEYSRIDLFVHASLIPEPFGQVVAEAMASGCLVVAPDRGGPTELVRDATNGITYELGSRTGLAAALRRAKDLPADNRAALVQCARETAGSLKLHRWLLSSCALSRSCDAFEHEASQREPLVRSGNWDPEVSDPDLCFNTSVRGKKWTR